MRSRGTLHLVVGPSGAGKDTLIDVARAARPDILFPVRVITRPADAGGEQHRAASEAAFAAEAQAGGFALSWAAHGLRYGIPAEIETALETGRHVVANVSRSVVADARTRFMPLRVLLVTASPAVLATRLAGRGRESAADIAERLERSPDTRITAADTVTIQNDGDVEAGARAFLAALCAPTSWA